MFLFNLTTAVFAATPNTSQGQCSEKHYMRAECQGCFVLWRKWTKKEVTWYKYNPEKTLKPERHIYRRVVVIAGQVLSW